MDANTIAIGLLSLTVIAAGIALWRVSVQTKQQSGTTQLQESQELVQKIRETVLSQILNVHTPLLNAIAKQKTILNKQDRTSIAIFITPEIFKELMDTGAYSKDQIDALYDIMQGLGAPVGFMGDLPIYISTLLEDAPVFVSGSIIWEM